MTTATTTKKQERKEAAKQQRKELREKLTETAEKIKNDRRRALYSGSVG